MALSQLSQDEVSGRTLFSLGLPTFETPPPELGMPSPHFVCLLAGDFRQATVDQISAIAEHLLASGACYFVCWGPDCERVHDIVDEVLAVRDPDPTDDSVILTTWHAKESLDDALHFFLTTCWPANDYFDTAKSSLAITVRDDELARQVRGALADPGEFIARVCEDDANPTP